MQRRLEMRRRQSSKRDCKKLFEKMNAKVTVSTLSREKLQSSVCGSIRTWTARG